MRPLRGLVVCWFAAVVLSFAPAARAQDAQGNTFNLQLFRPAVDSKGYFTVNASQVLGHLDFSIGLVGIYARDVLVLRDPGVFRVSDFITAQLQGALGLFKWGELGVSLPVQIMFGSRGPSYVDPSNANLNNDLTFGGQMVGDLGLHPKVRILNTSKYPVGLAVLTSVYLPTGDSKKFLGEGNVTLRPEIILDKEFGYARRFRMALNVGALIRFDKNTFTDQGTTLTMPAVHLDGTGKSRSLGTQVTYSLAIAGAVVPQKFELVAEIYGYSDVTGSANAHPMEWLAGGKVYLASKSYLQFGAGTGIIPDQTGSPEVRAFIGFLFEPSIGDRDGDGIKDDVDKCPDEPEDFDDFEDEDGCPDPDNDKDGILDVDDLCPNQPEDKDGFEDQDGCPDPDNDKDGILDKDDKCPNAPETYNGFQDEDGCPDKGIVRVRRGVIQLFDKIHFETARATIKPISFPILNAVAASLKGNPQLKLVEVQGHADERGDDDYNMRLTEDRAQAVKQYLIGHGIDAERLQAHGYGETKPICARHNDTCWSQNRRVEFIILRQDGAIPGQQ